MQYVLEYPSAHMRRPLAPYAKGVAAVGSSVETASGEGASPTMGWYDRGGIDRSGNSKEIPVGRKRCTNPNIIRDCRHWNWSTLLWVGMICFLSSCVKSGAPSPGIIRYGWMGKGRVATEVVAIQPRCRAGITGLGPLLARN